MAELSEIKDKDTGVVYGIKDATARAAIEELKQNGTGGTTTETVTESGIIVELETSSDAEITVRSDATGTVALYHSGLNRIPNLKSEITQNGMTITPNANGTVTISGKPTAIVWANVLIASDEFYLPAGSYVVKLFGFTDACAGIDYTLVTTDDAQSAVVAGEARLLTLTVGKMVKAFYTIRTTYSGEKVTLSAMVATGITGDTPFEKSTARKISTDFPATLTAYDGKNILYTATGDELTVTATTSISNGTTNAQPTIDYAAYGLPMLYLEGDTSAMTKEDAVDLTYRYGDRSGIASVKWQGSSSLSYPKKNYTIKFDLPFEAKEGWGEQKKYCFKANYIDHSHARNICSCQIWGQIVKSRANVPTELSSLPNGGAIDGFPCIIMLNGKFHGLYTWNIPKDGWMFGNPKAILCADTHCAATQFKALATLNGDFELEYVEDENNADWVLTSLNRAIQAVLDSDGSNLDATVGQYIDIPSAIDYYIHTVYENADDGTDKNYILVTFDGVKWYFSAYDRDTVYGLFWNGSKFTSPWHDTVTFNSYAELHRLMNLVKTGKASELKARAEELRLGARSEENVAMVFTNFAASIPTQILDEDARVWPTLPSTNASNTEQILNWYRLRVISIDNAVKGLA